MTKQRTTQISLVVVMAALAAVFFYILLNNIRNGEQEIDISLPSAVQSGAAVDGGGMSPVLETELNKVVVTADNVQNVVASLQRPDSYHLSITVTNYYGDISRLRTVNHWVRTGNSRTSVSSDGVISNELCWDNTVYLWNDGDETCESFPKGDFSIDASAGMLTYEDLLVIPKEQILEASYEMYGDTPCIYAAAKDEDIGYISEYYIALDSGLLLYGSIRKETTPIYSMEVTDLTKGVFDETVFTLPTGQTLIGS